MILYHFTDVEHLPLILDADQLEPTESNIGSNRDDYPPSGEHVGPDVVWLTSSSSGKRQGLDVMGAKKAEVRITVDVEDAQPWGDFADLHGMHPKWRDAIEHGMDAASWWVVDRPITGDEWTAVERQVVERNKRAQVTRWVSIAERSTF